MPTTVLLIRHPESAWNRRGIYQGQTDTPLSPLGSIQAELVAHRLSAHQLAGIVTSPLKRAWTLAHSIGHHHGLEPQPDERLTEISHGVWEGMSRTDVATRFPEMHRTWQEAPHAVTFPDGESLHDVHERSVQPIADLLARDDDRTWVVVTHDTVARLVIAAARDQPNRGFSCVALENAAITTLVGPDLVGSVVEVNDVAHLGQHRVDLESQAL